MKACQTKKSTFDFAENKSTLQIETRSGSCESGDRKASLPSGGISIPGEHDDNKLIERQQRQTRAEGDDTRRQERDEDEHDVVPG